MNEENLGKGAIQDIPDERDYQFSNIARAIIPFNWDIGYDVEKEIGKNLSDKDQNGSSSCGGQAFGYYGEVLDPDKDEKSAKFIYSQVFVGKGGSAGRTICDLVKKIGWGTEKLTTSYENGNPPSEIFMERIEDITQEAFKQALTDEAISYANVNADIESIAQAIRENKGCVIGLTGKNNGSWLSKFPAPPDVIDNNCWNHWLYCGKVLMINGKKYIGFKNSWGNSVGENGWQYISEEYINSKNIWSVWTLVYNFEKKAYPTLLMGIKGDEVKDLQTILNIKLGCNLLIDGYFGRKTQRQVQLFQLKQKIKIDGVVGPQTWGKLLI